MVTRSLGIPTPDGSCDSFVAYPEESGRYSAVILYMDAFGPRHYLFQMARTLAERGYYVLVPNLFYRVRRAPVITVEFPITEQTRPAAFKELGPLLEGYESEFGLRDTGVFLEFLAGQKQVRRGAIGVTGYCMGGGLAIRAAARYPDRIAAAASFHAGRLVTAEADSPHLSLGRIAAEVYVAHADQDPHMTAEQIQAFGAALEKAGLKYEAETYEGARHGFTMMDLPAYDAEALKRHWTKLPALLGRALARVEVVRGPALGA